MPYCIVFLLFVFWGCMMVSNAANSATISNLNSVVRNFADVMNALMTIPNCIAVQGPSAITACETKHFVYDSNLEEVDTTEIPLHDDKKVRRTQSRSKEGPKGPSFGGLYN